MVTAYNEYDEELESEDDKLVESEEPSQTEEISTRSDVYHLTPEEAQSWINKIITDPKHPYFNDKAPILAHNLAVKFVERLYEIVAGTETSIEGYVTKYYKEQEDLVKAERGPGYFEDKHSSNEINSNQSWEQPDTNPDSIGYGEKDLHGASGGRIEDAFKEPNQEDEE